MSQYLFRFLQNARQSNRLIHALALAFVLSLGAATVSPAVQAANQTPDQQLICLGQGGMKLITFARDGSVKDVQITPGLDCPLCGATYAPAPVALLAKTLPAHHLGEAPWVQAGVPAGFEFRAPPARAPPIQS